MSGLGFADPSTLRCTADTCPIDTSFYNYHTSSAANVTFLVLYILLPYVCVPIWIFTRRAHFFSAATILGIIAETLGHAARIRSHADQWDEDAYFMQIICLTLAPALFTAGIYVCLARVVVIYGRGDSRIRPMGYTFVFIPCDVIALLLQAIGGGISAAALADGDVGSLGAGIDILTAGLSWQVFTWFCFVALCAEFAFRVRRRIRRHGETAALSQDVASMTVRRSRRFRAFLFAIGLATALIFRRCAYRVAELNDGFAGPVTYKQGLFVGFEGVLIGVAVLSLALMHPALCLGEVMEASLKEGTA